MAFAASAAPAHAQDEDEFVSPGGILPAGVVQSLDPADRLAMNLRLLAQNPRDVTALTQAGTSALEVGDPNAAIGFLARAEQLAPSSGRVKSALGSALTMLERPTEAIRFFNEAVAYGVPERDLWKDRGLAYDLSGDQRRAQRDYDLALRSGQDAETTRRLALSFGISGDRDQALRLLEPLIKRNDQGAWRAQAFVLAMTGDLKSAERIVEQVMPSGTLSPFLRRLPSLSVADRARAVNFGTMPSDGTQYATVIQPGAARAISSSASNALASAAQPVQPRFDDGRSTKRPSREPRRRPDREPQLAAAETRPILAAKPVSAGKPLPAPRASGTIAPGFSSNEERSAATPAAASAAIDTRVGKRIGPVEVDRLPEVLRPGAPPTQIVRVAGNSLPPPYGVVPAPVGPPVPAATKSVQVAAVLPSFPPSPAPLPPSLPRVEAVPAPVFEIADAKPSLPAVAPAPAPAILAPPVKLAVLSPAPPVLVASPAPQESVVVSSAAAPKPQPPASLAVNTPPKPISPAPVAGPSPGLLAATLAKPERVESATLPAPTLPAPVQPTTAPPRPALAAAVPSASLPAATPPTAAPAKLSGPSSQEAGVAGLARYSPTAEAALQSTVAPALTTTALPQEQLTPVASQAAVQTTGLASVLADLAPEEESRAGPLLSDAEFRRARFAAKRKLEAEALAESGAQAKEDAEAKAKREAEEERKREASENPARVWVQVATGANKSGLPITWRKLRDTAPDALKNAAAWYTPFRATNRLLVGPYKGQSEARALVNKLSGKGITATTFSSEAGQEIARLSSR